MNNTKPATTPTVRPSLIFRPGVRLLAGLQWQGRLLLLAALVALALGLAARQAPLSWALSAGGVSIYLLLALRSELAHRIAQLQQALASSTTGDLTGRIELDGNDELARLGRSIEAMNQALSAMVAHVRSNTALVAYSGQGLTQSSRDLSDRTSQQAASLEQTTASVQQLSTTVQQTAQAAQEVSQLSAHVHAITEQGRGAMSAAVASMTGIQESSRRVQDIVGLIDGIAFQTNILALNAAVEAARAGDQGRGFAVVAAEVRTLAQRSATAAREIKDLIALSATRVDEGVQSISSAGQMMTEVMNGMGQVTGNIGTISRASAEQSNSLGEVSQALAGLDQITQQNAHMVDGGSAAAQTLQQRAGRLADAVSAFRLRQGTAEEAMAMIERALQHHRERGPAALQDFNAGDGLFIDRDLYLFGIDDSGVYRVFGGQPAKLNTRMQDVPGIDGGALVDKIRNCIAQGGGWVEYDFRHPVSGELQPKMSYVMRCGDINLGCGVYQSLVA